jgi:hypothetical protein
MPGILLTALLILVVVLVITCTALYFIPIEALCSIGFRDMFTVRVDVQWGIISLFFVRERENEVGVKLLGATLFKKTLEEEGPKEAAERPEEKTTISDVIDAFHQFRPFVPYLKSLAGTVWRSLKIHSLHCRLCYGCTDAAITGELFGYLWALKGILSPCEKFTLEMEPDFEQPRIEGSATLRFGMEKPLLFLIAGLRIARPLWRLRRTREEVS